MEAHRRIWHGAMSLLMVIAITSGISACGTTPDRPLGQQFEQQPWARLSVEQAYAECHHAINSYALGSNMYLCMKSKGYNER